MKIEGCVALVTGANRGLGKAYTEALLAAGAAKVYAGARDPSSVAGPGLTPIKLDVTSASDIAAAAARCGDVNLLVNNAGILLMRPMLAEDAEAAPISGGRMRKLPGTSTPRHRSPSPRSTVMTFTSPTNSETKRSAGWL